MNSFSSASRSGLSSLESWWKFLWKACHNWLPTFAVLATRKLPVDVLCPVYHLAPESVGHALWFYNSLKVLRQAWLAAHGSGGKGSQRASGLLWRSEYCQNHLIHAGVLLPAGHSLGWASSFMADYQAAKLLPGASSDATSQVAAHILQETAVEKNYASENVTLV
ncbi:hypothetical protein JRO89_XS08G0050900 [Xanthoceras sorbifolium]|uniref:Uncharacterized protein n=1 Tax=Xanthoceras sorbifolium TaxID=99658 RepID=A0ABQ8HNX3_9ROSI|nr:hypothetical protein JRO89_XS08G0050900 [Xanthoceras sorbifolium]